MIYQILSLQTLNINHSKVMPHYIFNLDQQKVFLIENFLHLNLLQHYLDISIILKKF